jgi:hypothetical protein
MAKHHMTAREQFADTKAGRTRRVERRAIVSAKRAFLAS